MDPGFHALDSGFLHIGRNKKGNEKKVCEKVEIPIRI